MSLIDAYDKVKANLRPQVQGTCGLYSFYNGVQILRQIDPKLPTVPAAKKSEASAPAAESLRKYAKREMKSGQGEILSSAEMTAFVKAWGYRCEASTATGSAARQDFLTIRTRASQPVLIAYLADQDPTGIVPVPNASSGDPGAHWSLVIGTKGGDALVVEPNDPGTLRTWPLAGLLLANAMADAKRFVRFWSKTVTTPTAVGLQTGFGHLPKHQAVGIDAERTAVGWAPSTAPHPLAPAEYEQAKTKLYDLGGRTGSRQDQQHLSGVLIALLPS
jgi:hypothetical protein